jgi:O-acetyl-ADP-ribose deacetylase (regulator of RNase III)
MFAVYAGNALDADVDAIVVSCATRLDQRAENSLAAAVFTAAGVDAQQDALDRPCEATRAAVCIPGSLRQRWIVCAHPPVPWSEDAVTGLKRTFAEAVVEATDLGCRSLLVEALGCDVGWRPVDVAAIMPYVDRVAMSRGVQRLHVLVQSAEQETAFQGSAAADHEPVFASN